MQHLVVIMADQLRMDALGRGYTPHIDALTQESVVFDRAYCASPLCVPARGAFFTGRYPNQTGSIINPWVPEDRPHGSVRSGTPHLYQTLESRFDSWHAGKQHFLTEDKYDHSARSTTHWHTEDEYGPFLKAQGKKAPGGPAYKGILPELTSGRVTRKAEYSIPTTGVYEEGFDCFFDGFFLKQSLEALRQRDRSRPFALNAMFLAPHPPLQIPEPWYSMVKNVELPTNVGVWSPNQSPLQLYNLTGALGTRYTREDWQKIWPVYLGLVALLDHCVGQIVAELKAQGIYDETLIVFTSDHGEMLGSHCLWQKMCMYEESARTPLSFKFPKSSGVKPRHDNTLVSAIDVFPTLGEALELPVPAGVSGQSLMPAVRGGKLARERIFMQYDGNGARGNFQRCVVQGSHKLIVDMFKDELFLELYDLANDPQEMRNLAFEPEHRARVESLLSAVRGYMKDTGDLLAPLPDDTYETFLKHYERFKK